MMLKSGWVNVLALSAAVSVAPGGGPRSASEVETTPAAMVGEIPISVSELEQLVQPKLARIRAEEYLLRRRVLDERIQQLLLHEEARRQDLSVEALLKVEVEDRLKPVTKEEALAVYESSRERYSSSSEEEAVAQIRVGLARQRAAMRHATFVSALRSKAKVVVLLEPPRVAIRSETGPSRGAADAAVTIVAFSDFECQYCGRSHETLRALEQRFVGKVRLVYRHFPLPFHKNAARAAEAAACADEQGYFWEMHDRIFSEQKNLARLDMTFLAQKVGMDPTKFDECLATGRGSSRVTQDRNEAETFGVTSTPTFFVNGRFVAGAVPVDAFASLLEDELTRLDQPVPRSR